MIPFTLWLALIWGSAINGVFRGGITPFPLIPFAIFLPVIIGTPIMLLSKRIGQVLDAMPASWLIALQAYRVLGSAFLIGWARGLVPGVFALPAGIGDVTTGLLAVPVAILLAAGGLEGRKAAVAWNVFASSKAMKRHGVASRPSPTSCSIRPSRRGTAGVPRDGAVPSVADGRGEKATN